MASLDSIGLKHGTDKSSKSHNYLGFYERFFCELRDKPIRLLEIGVFQGKSVAMWREYFNLGDIIGVDINPDACQYANERIRIEIADASNVADLVRLGTEFGPFDIIIDDGSHYWDHQVTSLKYLLPFLKENGFYIIEDIDTSFGRYVEDYRRIAAVSAFDYIQKLSMYVTGGSESKVEAEVDPFIRTYAERIEFIAFHQATVLLRTRVTFEKRDLIRPPQLLVPTADDLPVPPASLRVHLGRYGDVIAGDALIGGKRGSKTFTVQGFVVEPSDERLTNLTYKALFSDGTWSDWTTAGGFVGTRGKSITVRGLAVQLVGELASQVECVYACAFVGDEELVQGRDGGECVGQTGGDLESFQIVLRRRQIPSL